MSTLLEQIQALVAAGRWDASDHGKFRRSTRGFSDADLIGGIMDAVVVEEYPTGEIGPSLLSLQYDAAGQPLHVVWGIKESDTNMTWVITAYRPDERWGPDLMTRRSR